MQEFGSVWTEAKLDAIESYLSFYTTALSKRNYRLCYIDAFAGSGNIRLKTGKEIQGSALRALRYPFDKFHFLDNNRTRIKELEKIIHDLPIREKVEFHCTDCNSFLLKIDEYDWVKENWRGVVFLDPYAMDLEWRCLEKLNNTKIFDVWYLFPYMAINRNLNVNGNIPIRNKEKIDFILGTTDWDKSIYMDSPQLSFFDDIIVQKRNTVHIRNYILSRLKGTFPTVSDKAIMLRNNRNSPQFLLCFAGSNPSTSAQKLSLKAANYILEHIE